MYKIGKYLVEADNAVEASSAVLCLNRRKSLEEHGEVVLRGKKITYTLLKSETWFKQAVVAETYPETALSA